MKLWVHLFREAVDRWSGSTFFDVLKTTQSKMEEHRNQAYTYHRYGPKSLCTRENL